MARFATGKYAYGISDRSGFRYRLKDMRREWNGLLVGPDEYEPKHPQLRPIRISPDAEALRDPRPDTNNIIPVEVSFPVFDLTTLQFTQNPSVVGEIGSVSVSTTSTGNVSVSATGVSGTGAIGSSTVMGVQVFAVTVVSTGYGNKYFIDGAQQATVNLSEGSTYMFDQSDSSNSGHPLRLSTTSDGTHGGGSEYTTGVTTSGTPGNAGAYTQITVAVGAPTLYYYCTNHSGMGGQANTP